MHIRVILLCSFLLVTWSSFAQIQALEDSVFLYRTRTFNSSTDSARLVNDDQVYRLLLQALKSNEAMKYPFAKLRNISVQNSTDHKLRLFTWNVQLENYTHRIRGIAMLKGKGKTVQLIELRNWDTTFTEWERMESTPDRWFGATYYRIIPHGSGTYLLLGWKGVDRLISQKVVEVVTISGNTLKFGQPLIQHGNQMKHRAIFNYPADVVFTLKFEKDEKRIVFDRLAPLNQSLAGNYAFYTPQFVFDAYVKQKNKWVLLQDVDVKSPERERKTPALPPHLTEKPKN